MMSGLSADSMDEVAANPVRKLPTPYGNGADSGPPAACRLEYDGHYTYALRIDPDRATPETQQHSESDRSPAGSLSKMRQPEREDHRSVGVLSDPLFPV